MMFELNIENINLNMVLLVSLSLAGAVYSVIIGISRILFLNRLKTLELAMVRYPNYADVRAQLGSLYYSYGYLVESKKYYYEAIKIYPYYHYARLKLGLICLDTAELDEAMHHFRKIRLEASHDENMISLLEKLMKEKLLYDEYMKDPGPYDDNYFKAKSHKI